MVLDTEKVNASSLPPPTVEPQPDPFEPLSKAEWASDDLTESIVVWTRNEFGVDAFVAAKEEFDWKTGKVFYDDPFYDQRISYFLDYFTYQRPLAVRSGQPQTPYSLFLNSVDFQAAPIAPDIRQAFHNMERYRHSVFKIRRIAKQSMIALDLISGERFEIVTKPNQSFAGFSRNDTFQGFVFPQENAFCLSNGILLHPAAVLKIVRKMVRNEKSMPDFNEMSFLSKLALVNIKYLRHSHLSPQQVYAQASI